MFGKKDFGKAKVKLKERQVSELIEKLLNSGAKKLIAPVSQDCFLIDEENQVNICIDNTGVKIANHKYLYEVNLPLKVLEAYKSQVIKKVEEEVAQIKKQLFANEIELLKQISGVYDEV